MISFNNSDWLIPITQYYFYIIYIWAYNSGMQIEDLVPFNGIGHMFSPAGLVGRVITYFQVCSLIALYVAPYVLNTNL